MEIESAKSNYEPLHSSSPEYIVLDEDDNEIKLKDDLQPPVNKKQKISNDPLNRIEYLKNLPTLLPLSEIKLEKPPLKNINIQEFFNEWKEQDLSELLLVNDYVYNDPLIKKMTPHESYVYTLGLNLVLDSVTNSYKNSLTWLNNKQKKLAESSKDEPAKTIFNLKLGIENEREFLENLEDNTAKIKEMNTSLIKAQNLNHSCKICNFKTDSMHILDQHLTHPHNLHTKGLVTYRDTFTSLKCNFCEDFKTISKDEYARHIQTIHRRLFMSIKPNCAYNCNFCDYECREKHRFLKHQQQCIYNNQQFISSIQKPTLDDDLDYEFLFPNSNLLPNKYVLIFLLLWTILKNSFIYFFKKTLRHEFIG